MRTRWTLPRNCAEENQDRIWSTWAPFRQPEAFGYDPTSINKKLWVNATTSKEKLPFAPPWGMPLSVVQRIGSLAAPYRVPHLIRKRRGPFGTGNS